MENVARDMLSQEFDFLLKKSQLKLPQDKLAHFFIEKGVKMMLDAHPNEIAMNKIKVATESGATWGRPENSEVKEPMPDD